MSVQLCAICKLTMFDGFCARCDRLWCPTCKWPVETWCCKTCGRYDLVPRSTLFPQPKENT